MINKPLYRGVDIQNINLDDYKKYGINYWPGFSSTSKLKEFAVERSKKKKEENEGLIFEIFCSNQNSPVTNLELPRSWSFYPSEEEVLLLPFFCF